MLGNLQWQQMFTMENVTHLPQIQSDHLLVLINLNGDNEKRVTLSFQVLNAWFYHKDFLEIIRKKL